MECFEPGSFALYSTPSRTNYQDIFQAFCISCVFNCDDLIGSAFISSSHSSNMSNSYIHHVIFSGYITNPFNGQLPVGSTGILEVRVRIDSNPGKLDFLRLLAFLFFNCISCVFSRDDLLRIYYTSSFRS